MKQTFSQRLVLGLLAMMMIPAIGFAADGPEGMPTPQTNPVFERMKADGVEVVKPIGNDPVFGHECFFVRGPDKVLIEIVEDKPVPEGIWE